MKARSTKRRLAALAKEVREEKARSANERAGGERAIDSFFRSVYDSLAVRVMSEAAADVPPGEDELDAIERGIAAVLPPAPAPKKRART